MLDAAQIPDVDDSEAPQLVMRFIFEFGRTSPVETLKRFISGDVQENQNLRFSNTLQGVR